MQPSICVRILVILMLALSIGAAPAESEIVRVRLDVRPLPPGARAVVLKVYAAPEGGDAISSDRHEVRVDERGSFTLPVHADSISASGAA